MRTMSRAEWIAEGEKRFGADPRKWVFVCPMCKTPQSAESFYAAGVEPGKGEASRLVGYSCIGRLTHSGPPTKIIDASRLVGCDWTLGGLFQVHDLVVTDDEGNQHPCFVFAEPGAQPFIPGKAVAA